MNEPDARKVAAMAAFEITSEQYDERIKEADDAIIAGEVMVQGLVERLFYAVMSEADDLEYGVLIHARWPNDEREAMDSFWHSFEKRTDFAAFLRRSADEAEVMDKSETFLRTAIDPESLRAFVPDEDLN